MPPAAQLASTPLLKRFQFRDSLYTHNVLGYTHREIHVRYKPFRNSLCTHNVLGYTHREIHVRYKPFLVNSLRLSTLLLYDYSLTSDLENL